MITYNWTLFFVGGLFGIALMLPFFLTAYGAMRRLAKDLQERLARKDKVIAAMHADLIIARGLHVDPIEPCKCEIGGSR